MVKDRHLKQASQKAGSWRGARGARGWGGVRGGGEGGGRGERELGELEGSLGKGGRAGRGGGRGASDKELRQKGLGGEGLSPVIVSEIGELNLFGLAGN